MDVGYIKYNGKIIKVVVLERHGNYIIVQTEDNEILGIPPESGTHIWKTAEECRYYEEYCIDFVPMENRL